MKGGDSLSLSLCLFLSLSVSLSLCLSLSVSLSLKQTATAPAAAAGSLLSVASFYSSIEEQREGERERQRGICSCVVDLCSCRCFTAVSSFVSSSCFIIPPFFSPVCLSLFLRLTPRAEGAMDADGHRRWDAPRGPPFSRGPQPYEIGGPPRGDEAEPHWGRARDRPIANRR